MAEANYTNVGEKRLYKAGTQSVELQGITTVYPAITMADPGETIMLCAADAAAQGDRVEAV